MRKALDTDQDEDPHPAHVQPEQPDDAPVALGPDLGREQLTGGHQPPAGAARARGGTGEYAHATMSAGSGPTLGARPCQGAVRGSCSTGATRAPLRCCWCIRAGRCGPTGTPAPGPSPRATTATTRT